MSATARLAARRGPAHNSTPSSTDEISKAARAIPKRSALEADDGESTPRKRVRTTTASRESSADVVMTDSAPEPVCGLIQKETNVAKDSKDIYEFSESSADELMTSKTTVKSPKASKKPDRRGKLATYTSRSIAQKGISAPARLAEMIATDTDTTEPSTRSPSVPVSRKTTPQQPSTPPSMRIGSPETAIQASGTMTPKQAQLWDRLLRSDPVVPSPSALAMKDLTITSKRRVVPPSTNRTLTKSQSNVPRRRTRLVDRLKASAPSSDDDSSEEHAVDDEDAEMGGVDTTAQDVVPAHEDVEDPQKVSTRRFQSQSQSQSQGPTGGGPKITYSRTRSYLPEDVVEDDLMLGFSVEIQQDSAPTRRSTSKSAPMSQKSAFDLDDDDEDDNGAGRIRTIHELRASGSNTRGMWDIEEALEDIKHHNVSQRSRRRTALIELATKMADKTFAARFMGQSCELRLVAECGAVPDEIADFVLAAAVALLMASEPPEHAIRSLQEQGVVAWLTQLLEQDVEISKLAKDRRNNMSKASQSSLLEFGEMLRRHSSLWNEDQPHVMAPRLIALKALDQIVSRLRRLGEQSELLSPEELKTVLRHPSQALEQGKQIDVSLSVSVLESLSTAALSLAWPSRVLEGVREILPRLSMTSPLLHHTQFLALRLCLNLTKDNRRNCALLSPTADHSTVHYLVEIVKHGFETLDSEQDDEKRTVALDFLILAIGIMINLAEYCQEAREHAVKDLPLLAALVDYFQQGQKRMLEAESVEESISNVTFGYLAVMLANLCQSPTTRGFIASKLPNQNLGMLVEAVEEFILHHQKVDTMNFNGEEGKEVWGAFTEKLKAVLARLKEAELGTLAI